MKTPEERRWELMQAALLADSRGDAPIRVASTRTLFGIKSHAEEVIERVAAEESARLGAISPLSSGPPKSGSSRDSNAPEPN